MQNFRFTIFLFAILCNIFPVKMLAQSRIEGVITIDSTWAAEVYLSIIPNFDQLNSMSNQMIIDKAEIDAHGRFSFETDYLPKENRFYRIHLSKKGDPPASLIIGGNDENHMFFIANKNSELTIKATNSESLFGNVEFTNSPQSQLLKEVNKMLLYVDTTAFFNTPLKKELMESALDEKLRQFADTCSFPLVALYAIYKSNFERCIETKPELYQQFLARWETERSDYLDEFREKIPSVSNSKNYSVLFGLGGLFFGILIMFFRNKKKERKTQSDLQELTMQERKVYALLQQQKSNKEISDELNVSLSTVKSHVNNIFSKLNINSRKEVLNFKTR